MHTSTRYVAALIALALAGAAPAAQAQDRDTRRSGMPMGDMQGMCTLMSGMHEGPEVALMHAQHLGLSDAQRSRLVAARARVHQAHATAQEQMRGADREIGSAAGGDRVNETALRNAFRRVADIHAQAAVAMLRARDETRATLTAAQRAQLAQFARGGAMRDSAMAMPGPMRRDSMGMRHDMPMGRDSGGMMRRARPAMGDSTGGMGGVGGMGHMGMMMNHCGWGADSSGAHRL